jgi:membrane fusion protein (multidrug efflux system)
LLVGAALVGGAGYFLYPRVVLALTTVSTDDAYVNSHVTHVAPRIAETVLEVRVDDNDFVKKGDLLVRLDEAMSRIRTAQAEAALESARKSEDQAMAMARATMATAKADRYKLASAISEVRNQLAGLRVAIARWEEGKAQEKLAKAEADRYVELAKRNAVTQEQADVRRTDYDQARARVRQALEQIHSLRAGLELPEEPPAGKPYDDAPPDLDQIHSSVRAALGALSVSLAQIGLQLPPYYENANDFIASMKKMAPDGDIDALIERTLEKAPGVAVARAQVRQSEQALAEAQLQLSYCTIRSDISGFVSNRSVNPGDRVAQGQRLMAVRSLDEVWIDANFKETQLEPIRIGQPVDLHVDAYPNTVFRGRVSGFNPGTGSAMALLPAQNATGNFVKIVQRLPVRIDLIDGNPKDTPLFIGLSVTPRVRIRDRPEGPNAGGRLRIESPRTGPDSRPATDLGTDRGTP